MPNKTWMRCVAAIGAASLTLTTALHAQEQRPVPPGMEGFYGKESPQGVYVRDSAVALEKFPLVQRLERMNEWGKAADVLQEVLEKYPDRVIQIATNEQSEIIRYGSIGTAIRQRIARWPAEGLAAYRARFELPAQTLLEATSPTDIPGLRKVYSQYFNTESGKTAALRLIDLYFRAGDFRAAADIANQVIEWHPLVQDERPELLYRSALCAHLLNDQAASRRHLETLQKEHPDATGLIRGEQVVLAQSLQQELTTPPPASTVISDENWPMFGGDPSRGRVSTSPGGIGARLFSIPLSQRDLNAYPPDERAAWEAQAANDRREGATLGVMPVVDNGELFFQDGRRIYGLSLESGVPLPGWSQTYAGSSNGAYIAADCPPLPPGQQLNVAVTADSVLAIMGFTDRSMGAVAIRDNGLSRVVCLDRRTGREKWVMRPQDLPEDEGALRQLAFSGSPLVVGDNVHVLGRGGKGAQFEDCYLITLDLATGRHKWSTYIASSSTQNMTIFGSRNALMSSDTTSHISYASGRLFVATNLGAVAAIDAYTGAIEWLSIYDRNIQNDPMRLRRFGGRQPSPTPRPFTFNPAIVQDDHLFVLPTDSDSLLIYNATTGELVKSISRRHLGRPDLGEPDTLVGVFGDRLIVSADFQMLCMSWSRYDPDEFSPTNEQMIYWPVTFPRTSEHMMSPVRGRAFVTTNSVLVSTARRLERIDMKTGRRIGSYPAGPGEWNDDEGPGNVVIAGDRVIVAGDRSVDVYTDLALARAKLEAEIAAAPRDPGARLRYAEMMFVAGESAEAMQRLDEAFELLGGRDQLRPGPERDRLFNVALAFAQKSNARGTDEGRALAKEFYARAGVAAASPAQQVNLRLSRAQDAAEAEDYDTVVRMYQEILSDAAMRAVSLTHDQTGATQAAVVAQREIGQVIRDKGRSIYRPFEEAAAAALQQANEDADALIAVAREYPNSTAAATALTAAARNYEKAGNHRLATQTLRQVAYDYPESFDKARGLEAMARNYLAMPNRIEVATARLAYGVRAAGNPKLEKDLLIPGGETIPAGTTFADAVKTLRSHTAAARNVELPDFKLPSRDWAKKNPGRSPFAPPSPETTITSVSSLVVPERDRPRHDRVITWSPQNGLAVYAVGQNTPIGATDAITGSPVHAAWLDSGLLVAAQREIALLHRETAEPIWVARLPELPAVEYVIDRTAAPPREQQPIVRQQEVVLRGRRAQRLQVVNNWVVAQELLAAPKPIEGPERIMQVSVTDDRVLATTSTGRLLALDLATGNLAWQTRLLDNLPIDRIVANSDFAVARTITDSDVQLVVLDTYGGKLITRRVFATSTANVPVNFALAPDGTLVYALPDRLCAKDLYEPGDQLTWEATGQTPGRRIFQNAIHPDQLKIADGRVLIVSNEGTDKPFVRLHSLETGRPIRYAQGPGGQEIDAPLQTEATGTEVRLFLHRPYLYVMSQQMVIAYNLDRPDETWRGSVEPLIPHNMADVLIGRNHLLLLDASTARPDGRVGISSFIAHAYSRAQLRGVESGLLDHVPTIQDDAGILSWQAVDGGLYYLAGDGEVHFLKGLGEP